MMNLGGWIGIAYPRSSGGGGTIPAAPTIGTASVSAERAVSVTFTPNSDGGSPILHYTVLSSPGNISNTGSGSPIVVSNLTPGTSYTFTVTATNAIGTSASSAASNAVVAQGKPDAPTALSATAGNAQATVSFTPPANNGGSAITGYTVTSSPGGISQSGASSPITVTGLTNNTSYTFTAVATNAYGNSPASAASNAVTPQAPGTAGPFDSLYTGGWMPVTGTTVYTPPVQATPAKSTGISSPSYTDANYGTKIFRVANLTDAPGQTGNKMRHEYARRCPFNCDNTRFILQSTNGFFFLYDAATFQRLDGGVTTNDAKLGAVGTNSIHPKDPRDWSWHPTDPNKIIFFPQTDGLTAYEFDVVTKVLTTAFTFSGRLGAFGMGSATRVTMMGEGRPSDDCRYWGFMVKGAADAHIGYITYDRQTDTILGGMATSSSANSVTMSSKGSRFIISQENSTLTFAQCEASPLNTPRGARAYTLDFSSFKQLHYTANHADVGIDVDGNEVYISMSPNGGLWNAIADSDVFMIPVLGTGGPTKLINVVEATSQWNSHYSGCSAPNRPGWWVFSSYDSTDRGARKYGDDNIMLIQLKANPTIYRLADHRTTRFTYWQEPHATISRDGLRVMYSCAWDSTSSSTPHLSYMIGLPSWIYGGAGGGGGGPTPILNFTFADAAGWSLGTSCAVTGGKLHCNNNAGNVTNIYSTASLAAGTYDIQYTISDFNAGNVTMRINSGGTLVSGTTRSFGTHPAGTYTDRVTIASTSSEFQIRVTRSGTAMDVKLDDVTVTAVP